MTKLEFLEHLEKGLVGLPSDDVRERLAFYGEMIDDKIEDGIAEEDAVCEIGDVQDIITQITMDIPLSKIVKQKIKAKRRISAFEIVLLVLGSPIWLALLSVALAVVFSLYVSLWSIIISLWAVFVSVLGCGIGGVVSGAVFTINGPVLNGVALIAAGLISFGFSILAFYGCKAATKGILLLTKKIALFIKNCFIKKEIV